MKIYFKIGVEELYLQLLPQYSHFFFILSASMVRTHSPHIEKSRTTPTTQAQIELKMGNNRLRSPKSLNITRPLYHICMKSITQSMTSEPIACGTLCDFW